MAEGKGRLSGNHALVVDQKNRLVIPARFREVLGNLVKVGLHPQDNFFVLSVSAPDVYAERMEALEKRAENDPRLDATITLLDATTQELELDDQGRITLTAELKGQAGIERDVVVIGRGNHLQIWTQGRWEDFTRKAFETPGGLRESIFRRSQ
ncbi:MAG: hypothetical protein IT452_00470 [Planctomycetia bacterium]|nr:hypothetical protein [Planctomycetia bacterium]